MSRARQYRALVRKDIRLELGSGETALAMLLFSLVILVISQFAFQRVANLSALAGGILWVTIALTAVLAVGRSWAVERDQRVLDGILVAPTSRMVMALAKATTIFGYLVLLELFAVPLVAILFVKEGALADIPLVAAVCLVANVPIALLGTLVSTLAVFTRARELILPVLFLPLVVPVVIAASGATQAVLGVTNNMAEYRGNLGLLAGHAVVLALVGYATYEALFDD